MKDDEEYSDGNIYHHPVDEFYNTNDVKNAKQRDQANSPVSRGFNESKQSEEHSEKLYNNDLPSKFKGRRLIFNLLRRFI